MKCVVFLICFVLSLSLESDDDDLYDFYGAIGKNRSTTTLNYYETTVESTSIATTTTNWATTRSSSNRQKCGRRIIEHVGLITNGFSTGPGDWPWHVAIYKVFLGGASRTYICGGSLISHTRVITAGHCVVENGAKIASERLVVYLGRHDLTGDDVGSQRSNVYRIVLHPHYNYTYLKNDIAILKLSTVASYTEYVQPICLWKENENLSKAKLFNKTGVVVGWGLTENDTSSNKLIMTSIPMIDDLECIESDQQFFPIFLNKNSYCAGYTNGTSPCNGDSGGGMYFSRIIKGKKYWFLRGIVSLKSSRNDIRLCDPHTYTIFTDVAQYLNFVKANIPR